MAKRMKEEVKLGNFTLKARLKLDEIDSNTVIPESDLCFQDGGYIYQFQFNEPENNDKRIIKPGVYKLISANHKANIEEIQLRERNLLTSVVNTQKIIEEAQTFFKKLHIYEELGEPKSRKVLLYSAPGFGKTSTITHFCQHACQEDPGTVVIIWPTNQVDADTIIDFLGEESEFTKECTRMILVAEDIGGGEKEGNRGSRSVDSGLLDLLDGIRLVFTLPTFIIATTNYPQNLLSALADRPGRFDLIMPLKNMSFDERIALLEFIGKKPLSDEDKVVFKSKSTEDFSVAHLKEIIVRSRLHDKSIATVVKEIVEHRKMFNNGFDDPKSLGFDRD